MTHPAIEALATARKASSITQAQLAERAGLSRMAVQRTETGDVDPRFSTVADMARVLDMTLLAVPAELLPAVQALIQAGEARTSPPAKGDAAGAGAANG